MKNIYHLLFLFQIRLSEFVRFLKIYQFSGFEKKRPVGSRQKEEETQSPEIGISAGGLDKRKRKPPKHLDEFEVSNLESTPLEEEPTKG